MLIYIQTFLLLWLLGPLPSKTKPTLEGTYVSCQKPPVAFTFKKGGSFLMEHAISLFNFKEGRGDFTYEKKELTLDYSDFVKNKLRVDKLYDPTLDENTLKLEVWETNFPYELIPNPNIDLLNRYGKKVNEWDTQLSKNATINITDDMIKMEISFPGHKRIHMELDKEFNSLKVHWPREISKIAPEKVVYKIKKLTFAGFIIVEYNEGEDCYFEKLGR